MGCAASWLDSYQLDAIGNSSPHRLTWFLSDIASPTFATAEPEAPILRQSNGDQAGQTGRPLPL